MDSPEANATCVAVCDNHNDPHRPPHRTCSKKDLLPDYTDGDVEKNKYIHRWEKESKITGEKRNI